MSDNEDLVRRLRKRAHEPLANTPFNLLMEAAETIEALSDEAAQLREAMAHHRLPKLTDKMIEAALVGHYGKKALEGGIYGVDLASDGRDYTFAQGFRRMWRGINTAMKGASHE